MRGFQASARNGLLGLVCFGAVSAQAQFANLPVSGLVPIADGGTAWGDFNQDGFLDFAMMGGTATGKILRVFRFNNSTKNFDIWVDLTGMNYGAPAWSDLDNDGDLDLIASGQPDASPQATYIWQNGGAGNNFTFTRYDENWTGLGPGAWCAPVVADFDRDGHKDVFIPSRGAVYRNMQALYFMQQSGTPFPGVLDFSRGISADFDKDGIPDIAISGQTSEPAIFTRIYKSNGNMTFSLAVQFPEGTGSGSLSAIDFDGDGDMDLLQAGGYWSPTPLVTRLFENKGAWNFVERPNTGLPGIYDGAASVGDYNNDGRPDILLAGNRDRNGNNSQMFVKVYRNQGASANPIFADANAGLPNRYQGTVSWGDYDRDSKLDILQSGVTAFGVPTAPQIHRNTGTVSKAVPTTPGNIKVFSNATSGGDPAPTITWTGSTAGATPANALTYNLQALLVDNNQFRMTGNSLASGIRMAAADGNAGQRKDFAYKGGYGPNYQMRYFVQAVDANLQGSAFALKTWRSAGNVSSTVFDLGNGGGTVNLASVGTLDWAQWGHTAANSFDHKAGVTNVVKLAASAGTISRLTANSMNFSWTGGTPTASATATATGITVPAAGNHFTVTAAAADAHRTLDLWLQADNCAGRVEAWTDDLAAQKIDETFTVTGSRRNYRYQITFKRKTAGTATLLRVKWSKASGTGKVGLLGAALY